MSECTIKNTVQRCPWAKSPLDIVYHDTEWGKPVYDDTRLFEFIVLESMQAGLSWATILHKREHMRRVFSGFSAAEIVQYDAAYLDALLQDPGIIRHKGKLAALVSNARVFLELQKQYSGFSSYIWNFVDKTPIDNKWTHLAQVPASTDVSMIMSTDMRKKGFKFFGATTCYAYMQAVGMVNDHLLCCDFRSVS